MNHTLDDDDRTLSPEIHLHSSHDAEKTQKMQSLGTSSSCRPSQLEMLSQADDSLPEPPALSQDFTHLNVLLNSRKLQETKVRGRAAAPRRMPMRKPPSFLSQQDHVPIPKPMFLPAINTFSSNSYPSATSLRPEAGLLCSTARDSHKKPDRKIDMTFPTCFDLQDDNDDTMVENTCPDTAAATSGISHALPDQHCYGDAKCLQIPRKLDSTAADTNTIKRSVFIDIAANHEWVDTEGTQYLKHIMLLFM
jgi:hypothetical protein